MRTDYELFYLYDIYVGKYINGDILTNESVRGFYKIIESEQLKNTLNILRLWVRYTLIQSCGVRVLVNLITSCKI